MISCEGTAEYFFSSRGHENWLVIFKSMQSQGLMGLVFETPLMGHLGCLTSRWSVHVCFSKVNSMGNWHV